MLGEAGFSVSLLRWVGWSLGEERVEVLWELVWSVSFLFLELLFSMIHIKRISFRIAK